MRKLFGLVLIVIALLGVKELHRYWRQVKARQAASERDYNRGSPVADAPAAVTGPLPGLPHTLEKSLAEARQQGAPSLKIWLGKYRSYVSDPRLAEIELDYVVLVGSKNFVEARELYRSVRDRTPTNSPIYSRVRQLERTYE